MSWGSELKRRSTPPTATEPSRNGNQWPNPAIRDDFYKCIAHSYHETNPRRGGERSPSLPLNWRQNSNASSLESANPLNSLNLLHSSERGAILSSVGKFLKYLSATIKLILSGYHHHRIMPLSSCPACCRRQKKGNHMKGKINQVFDNEYCT